MLVVGDENENDYGERKDIRPLWRFQNLSN
jgi:hypothetical protein